MSNVKQTQRRRALCPKCEIDVPTECYIAHMKTCTGKPVCGICKKTYTNQKNLKQHIRRIHTKKTKAETTTNPADVSVEKPDNDVNDDDDDDWDKDPEIELDFEDDVDNTVLEGRVVRKATTPAPVYTPNRNVSSEIQINETKNNSLDSQDSANMESSSSDDEKYDKDSETDKNNNTNESTEAKELTKNKVEEKGTQTELEADREIV